MTTGASETDEAAVLESRYQPYDFSRPDKVSTEHKTMLRNQFVPACRLLCIHFGTVLQAVVEMTLTEVEDLHYRDVFRPVPGEKGGRVLAVLSPGPEQPQGIVIASTNILFAFLERMMGGSELTPDHELTKDLTDFETKLFTKTLMRVLTVYTKSFGDESLVPALDKLETETTLIPRSYAPEEIMLRQIFRVSLNGVAGFITICLPFAFFRPLLPQMRHGLTGSHSNGPIDPKVLDEMSTVDVPVAVHLGRGRVTLRQLMALQSGDEIMLEGPVTVLVSEVPKFVGRPGLKDDHLAVEVVGPFVSDGKDEAFVI